eukprot:3576511-Rhodomonas_salina.1
MVLPGLSTDIAYGSTRPQQPRRWPWRRSLRLVYYAPTRRYQLSTLCSYANIPSQSAVMLCAATFSFFSTMLLLLAPSRYLPGRLGR